MPTTILQYLTRPNPKVHRYVTPGGLTVNPNWTVIEGVRPWKEFAYDTLTTRFKAELGKTIPAWDPTDLIKRSRFNETVNEDSVTVFLAVNSIIPVNNALWEIDKELHIGTGSKFARCEGAGSPDWGCGRADAEIVDRDNFCPGDVKCSSKWVSDGILEANWNNYTGNADLRNLAKPLEQVQHYCTHYGTRYGWILTDMELVVIRVTNSIDDTPTSPRQTRAGVGGANSAVHQRVVSDTSTLSGAFSAMSIDHSAYSGQTGSSSGNNPAPLEIACIPMSASMKESKVGAKAKRQLTVNLALFFLVLLASEDCVISSSYPSLGSQAKQASKSTSKSISKSSSKTPKSPHPQISAAPSASRFWIPAEGIQWVVIEADIEFYLPRASVKRDRKSGVDGYLITAQASKDSLLYVISCLKADTLSWSRQGGPYVESETYLSRREGVEEEDAGEDEDEDDLYGNNE